MNEMEEQLSRLFHSAVGEPPRRVTIHAIRRQVRRRRIVAAATATAVVAMTGSVGVALAANSRGQRTTVVSNGVTHHPPKFYIEQDGGQGRLQVRATATGAVTGQVRCPLSDSFERSMAAQANNRTFVMTCVSTAGQGGLQPTGTRIYRFRLGNAGQVGGYSLVRGGTFNGQIAGGIATSADGSVIAVWAASVKRGSKAVVVVINTGTGRHAVWTNPVAPDGKTFGLGDLSLAHDGRELAVFGSARCPKGDSACKFTGQEMRAVSPAGKGGKLSDGRVVFTQRQIGRLAATFINDAYLAADGLTVTLSLLGDGPQSDSVSAVQVSAATGKPLRVLFRLGTGNGFEYKFVTTDNSGKYILFDAGRTSGTVFGWVRNGKLVKLKQAGPGVDSGTW